MPEFIVLYLEWVQWTLDESRLARLDEFFSCNGDSCSFSSDILDNLVHETP